MTHRQQAPKPHPDWFWSVSGGIDSTAAFLLTKDIFANYAKRPVMAHFDTGIGVPLNRLFLEELADTYHEQLWGLRTDESFNEWVGRDDCPGSGAHPEVRNELKGRQSSKLNTLADNPVHIIGLRADESANRARFRKVEQKRRHVEVYPVHRLTQRDCARIILEHEDCPTNPFWIWPDLFSDCGCLCNGDPSELDAVEAKFPWFAQRMREIEESAEADGLRGTLGWDGLTAIEQSAARAGQQQTTLCSDGCQRERDPVVVQAFRARIHGATKDESIAVLDREPHTTAEPDVVADGGDR